MSEIKIVVQISKEEKEAKETNST